jgi:hypothetical protein
MVPWCFLPAVSRWYAGAAKVGLLPVVRPGLVGVDAAEHLVPSCSVHHDVLPCRGWDLAEEVDFSLRSHFVVVSFVVVAAVAVVAVAVTAVLWGGGGITWFACGDDVLWGGGGGLGGEKGGVEGSRAADWVEDAERAAGGVAAAVRVAVPCSAALVVAFSFVSAVVGVLLVVPVAVAAPARDGPM